MNIERIAIRRYRSVAQSSSFKADHCGKYSKAKVGVEVLRLCPEKFVIS